MSPNFCNLYRTHKYFISLQREPTIIHPKFLIPHWDLHQFYQLLYLSVDYDGTLFAPDPTLTINQQEEEWITSWSSDALSVERVFLNHSYDEMVGEIIEDDSGWLGRTSLWSRASGVWMCEKTSQEARQYRDPDPFEEFPESSDEEDS